MVADISDAFSFAPEELGILMPLLLAAGPQDAPGRARRIAHELAHDLMKRWVAPALYDTDTVICTDQDNRVARHDIARRVERLTAGEAG
jgi:hypothetical protein